MRKVPVWPTQSELKALNLGLVGGKTVQHEFFARLEGKEEAFGPHSCGRLTTWEIVGPTRPGLGVGVDLVPNPSPISLGEPPMSCRSFRFEISRLQITWNATALTL